MILYNIVTLEEANMKLKSLTVVLNFLDTLVRLSIITEADKAPVKNKMLDETLNASGANDGNPKTQ